MPNEADIAQREEKTADFIIFSIPRSGTSFLTTSLRSHPDILCHGETLLPRHFERHVYGSARQVLSAKMCENEPISFARRLFELRDGHRAVGFKVFRGHSPEAHETLLQDESIHKIILRRENSLASYSSGLVARKTGQWSVANPERRQKARVEFNPRAFDPFRSSVDSFFDFVCENCRGPRLDITYEDHIMNNRLDGVIAFLGADVSARTHSDKVKQLSRSILDRFENPDEALEHLQTIGREEWALE